MLDKRDLMSNGAMAFIYLKYLIEHNVLRLMAVGFLANKVCSRLTLGAVITRLYYGKSI